ncbi:proline-rich protein 2-like [Stegodyphus dumicola]|uniref:proline-rich protein 2-like n=1 Tax=Stegodyphus dumicola TaxID=202533 RepID=UPI0015AE293A|nr:proline-rich protein 2-like [Stegodyphus dumicola]
MSSYQFVNSLTSCYGQRSQDSSSQDYYTPQVQTYGGCYSGPGSPVQQYGPYPQHSVPHLQNGDHHFNSCSQNRLNHPNPSQSPRTPTPSVTPVPSCKYAEPSAASPQDLSTSGSHPPPAGSPESRTSPQPPRQASQNPQHPSPTHSQGVPPTQQSSSQQASPQQTQGPQDSSSPQAAQQGQPKAAYPNNPPQIYPWMRKVHVGQIEVCGHNSLGPIQEHFIAIASKTAKLHLDRAESEAKVRSYERWKHTKRKVLVPNIMSSELAGHRMTQK